MTRVALVRTTDRAAGVAAAIRLLPSLSFAGKNVFLKPNFNSADPTPGSTHNDTLRSLVTELQDRGAGRILLGDRSGMGNTREVMNAKGIPEIAAELGFDLASLEEMTADRWTKISLLGSHWKDGFYFAKPVLDVDAVVQTCCLKTHRFGGHFTMSLKNVVGMVAKIVPGQPWDYMRELHTSPYQRLMIAEMNAAYSPELIVLDGLEAIVEGGPDVGKLVTPGVIIAGTDRIAVDAVGVAILRSYGTTPEVANGSIFEQEQIARAVELGLGVTAPDQIELATDDPESASFARKIREVLLAG